MCGIIGRINYFDEVNESTFCTMRDTMRHRGPDGSGIYISEDRKIALGHRRLSINDLSDKGTQPMCNEDSTIWLTCNGEIYNYELLRKELEKLGHQFSSKSDSEVIIHGYEEWGVSILNKLKGMFAFAIWDSRENQLFLARDRFGIKPLYYCPDKSSFVFASELKGIVADRQLPREIDYSSFCDFFVYRYVPSPKTIWKNMYKLPPAHYMLANRDGTSSIHQYWDVPLADQSPSNQEAIEKVDEMLSQSIHEHTLSDVPLGSFLSGGYDSSAIVYYLNKRNYSPQTFSVGFENWEQSEHKYAEMVSETFKTKHTSKIIGRESLDLVEMLAYHFDEPIADISIVPTYVVSKAASNDVKAVLSGEGADEIFGGYGWHQLESHKNTSQSILSRVASLLKPSNGQYTVDGYSNAMAMGYFDQSELRSLLHDDLWPEISTDTNWFYRNHFNGTLSSSVKCFQRMDVSCFMSELVLTKIDRASMANSLEVRVPFLDHQLLEYMFRLSDKTYFKEGYKKYLLYENIKSALPSEILSRSKQGFVGPDSYYEETSWYKDIILGGELIADRIIRRETIEKWLQTREFWKLWKVLIMEFWYSKWCGANSEHQF